MHIVVCYKLTPDVEDIEVREDGTIDLDKAEWEIGEYDLQAIEAGVRLAEMTPVKITALSWGPKQLCSSKARKDLLSRGPDELVAVINESGVCSDTFLTAQVLAKAIEKIMPVDLVLCGEGSADFYSQQVGLQLGEILGWPTINAIRKIDLDGNTIVVERSLEEEVEILQVPLPAVISVTTDINQPRLPTMKEILKASKKSVTEWTLSDLSLSDAEGQVEVLSLKAPAVKERKKVVIPGKPEEAVPELIRYLKQDNAL